MKISVIALGLMMIAGLVWYNRTGAAHARQMARSTAHNVAFAEKIGANPSDASLMMPAFASCASPQFGAAANFPASNIPRQVALSDFNLDGKQDVVVTYGGGFDVTVMLGNGDGTLQAGVNYTVGANPYGVAVGDFNQDGKPDVVAAVNNDVAILLGNGDGTFQPALHSLVFQFSVNNFVAVSDYNRDGKQDLAVTSYANDMVSILLGNGDGSFQAATSYATGTIPSSVVAGDFNRDGNQDLAVTNEGTDNNLSILLGCGDGTFLPRTNFSLGTAQIPYPVATGDFNADGKLDIVTANSTTDNLSVLLGNGDGTFGTAVNYAVATRPGSVALADFNSDGKVDLAAGNTGVFAGDLNIAVMLGNGNGTFQPRVNFGGMSAYPVFTAVGDLNGDRKPDLITADDPNTPGFVSTLLNTCACTPPDVKTTGPAQVCASSAGNTISIPSAGAGASYVWTNYSFNGTITSATNTPGITFTAGASGTMTLRVTVTNAGGCIASKLIYIPITPTPASFTVNDLGDTSDACAGNGVCADATGKCTLRAAIEEANALSYAACLPLTINFSVTGTINLATPLPNILHHNLTMTGPGPNQLTVKRNGPSSFSVFRIINLDFPLQVVAISGLTISNGNVLSGYGGGIYNYGGTLTLNNCVLSGNLARGGGGLWSSSLPGASVTVNNCAITGNTADDYGGGIGFDSGLLTITGSTISGNTANQYGGGVTAFSSPVSLTNCTVSGNTALGTQRGGGIYTDSSTFGPAANVSLLNCTVANNTGSVTGGGGIYNEGAVATVSYKNTIVGQNNGPNFVNVGGTLTSQGNNLSSDGTGNLVAAGDKPNTNPKLAPLAHYGGPTQTHALLCGSPAIDAGTASGAPATDQRGVTRPQSSVVDIGAFENSININPMTLPTPITGTNYNQPLTVTGGTSPYSLSVIAGALPPWATLSSGGISGLPSGAGTYTFIIAATDANGFVGVCSYTLTFNCPTITLTPSGLPITILPSGTIATVYNQTITASPAGTYSYTVTSGVMPTGLGINSSTGAISGTPATPGYYSFVVTVTDPNGCTGSQTYSIFINCPGATITVTTTADTVAADGACSLREAIMAANSNSPVNECPAGIASPSVDKIYFAIGTGTPTINVASQLPTITERVIIDGSMCQSTRVELNGTLAGPASVGLLITGGDSTIRAMVINRFNESGINIAGAGNNVVENCYLGLNSGGTAKLANGRDGVRVNNSPNNRIGGLTAAVRNVISGNGEYGVLIFNPASIGNLVQGNYVGTDFTGLLGLGNGLGGVRISGAANNVIGGTVSGAGNVISGNLDGVFLLGTGATGNLVQANLIGLAANLSPLGNTRDGVQINGGLNNTIGGSSPGAGNTIRNNAGTGVLVADFFGAATGNAILTNSISNNGGLGIDLALNSVTGVTANDTGDGDTGPNKLQNFPILTSITGSGAITGTIDSSSSLPLRIEFFGNTVADSSGNGEGEVYLGSTTASPGPFTANVPLLLGKSFITATATDADGNTSEFSAPQVVPLCPTIVKSYFTNLSDTVDPNVTIDETVTFTLKVDLPEGLVPSLIVKDVIPPGMSVIGVTGKAGSGIPTANIPNPVITPTTVACPNPGGAPIMLTYGPINVPVDGNPNNNFVLITITAVVCDTPSNMGMPNSQTMLTNTATAQIGAEHSNCVATSNPVMLSVVEPKLAITKTFDPTTAKEGDMVTITLNVTNNGLSDAYNVIVEDPIPLWLFDTASITSCGTLPAGFTLTTPVVGGNTVVTFTGGNILKNQTVQFCFKGTVKRRCQGGSFNNVAKVKQAWTLPPGGGGGGGGNRPTAPQDNDQGRDESGATGEAQLIITPAMDCHCYGVTDMNGITRPPNYNNMVEWLKFDELTGNNAADSSTYGNNGTLNPASPNVPPTHVSGLLGGLTGNALMFDGIDDSVVVPDSATLNFGTGNFTIDAWINPDPVSVSGFKTILDKHIVGFMGLSVAGYKLSLLNGHLDLQLAAGHVNFFSFVSTPTILPNQWTHVAAVVTRTPTTVTVTFYINGASVSSSPLTIPFTGGVGNTSPLYVGSATPTEGEFFTGKIDEVEIFNIALEADTIAGIANAGSFGKCLPTPAVCCGKKPQWPMIAGAGGNFPSFGQVAIVTCYAAERLDSLGNDLGANDPVLVAANLKNQASAPIDSNWFPGPPSSPPAEFYHHPNWTRATMGDVFGLTIDAVGNVYVAASSVYYSTLIPKYPNINKSHKGIAGPGGIYKIDAVTAAVTPFVMTDQAQVYGNNNLLPNFDPLGTGGTITQAPGLGNITFDCPRNMFYVSNFEDGRIYRIKEVSGVGQIQDFWDHGANLAPVPITEPPNGQQGMTVPNRRVWAAKTNKNHLYYSVWRNDQTKNNGAHNEIWSVGLDPVGAFIGPAKLEISVPFLSAPDINPTTSLPWASPVSDISFKPNGNMLLAERSMRGDPDVYGHKSRVLEYVFGTSWTLSPNFFDIGKAADYWNASGGVDFDRGINGLLFATGDALHNLLISKGDPVDDVIYGLQGIPASGTGGGGNTTNSILIDLDGDITTRAKSQFGDVQIPCPAGSDCSGVVITISPATLPNLSAGVNYTSPPFTASGGTTPYTFSATGLPPNLTMSAGGVISGNAMQSGSFPNIIVTVTDANGCMGTHNYTLMVICNSDISISPPALPNGTVGTAYSQPFSALNGCGDFHFELVAGTLPPGMTLSATGVLSGTPTTCGSYPFSIKATDKCGCSAIKPYTLVIDGVQTAILDLFNTGVDNNHAVLADGAADTHYSLILPGGSGATPVVTSPATVGLPWVANNAISNWIGFRPATIGNYTYITNFQLPANCVGFSAVINGQWAVDESAVMYLNGVQVAALPGTATTNYSQFHPFSITTNFQPGANSLVIVVNNSTMSPTGLRLEMTGSYKCCPCQLAIGPDIIRGAAVGDTYQEFLLPIGGTAPYTFAITGGALPPGVSFSNGVLSGTPTAPGNFSFTVKLTDSAGCMTTRTYMVVVGCQAITFDPSTLRAGLAGVVYEQSLTQTGGVGTVTYSRTGGFLPAGLTLSAAGVLAGTPTTPGRSDFVVTATDANGCMAVRAYTLDIVCRTITITPQTLPGSSLGVAYSQTLAATGSAAPYTFTLVGGALPPGMSLNSAGVLSGTPTGVGSYSFVVKATDANGCTGVQSYVIAICGTIISPATLPNGIVGVPYNQPFSQPDIAASITWSVSAGSLPNGLTLNADTGVLSGTPTAFGTFNFTIRATDLNGCISTKAYTVMVCAAININPATLPDGTAGTAYNQTFTQSGGSGSISWSVSAGSLPGGLTLSMAGLLSGTPTATGGFSFMIQATDSNGCTGTRAYTLTINCPVITITPSNPTLPAGTVGMDYSQIYALSTTEIISMPLWRVSAGSVPTGLTLNSTTGVLSGRPTAAGVFNFAIEVSDANNCTGSRAYTLTINPAGNGLQFYPLPTPVRALETRAGFSGCANPGLPINANATFTLAVRSACTGIPANAAAVTGNATVVPAAGGYLTFFPSNSAQPQVANSNFGAGEVTNNVFTVGLGPGDGAFKIFSSATTEVIVDITGYYAPPGTGGLYFHVLPEPVRLLETRTGFTGCFAPGTPLTGTGNPNADPNLDLALQGRSPIPSPCNSIPASAQVLVGNATSVFPSGGGYLTIYPSGGTRPTVASSNYAGNDIVNGPFAVKLGADGKFKIYTFASTHLVVDILGYYSEDATDVNGAGLLFNPLPNPVRLLETRPDFPGFPLAGCTRTNAKIPGNLATATHTQSAGGFCGLPATAQAVVGNVSVVNSEGAGFLTLFPANLATAPLVATSNYPAPATFGYNRHYFVGLSPADGKFKVLTQFTTDLILDASGYFAP